MSSNQKYPGTIMIIYEETFGGGELVKMKRLFSSLFGLLFF